MRKIDYIAIGAGYLAFIGICFHSKAWSILLMACFGWLSGRVTALSRIHNKD